MQLNFYNEKFHNSLEQYSLTESQLRFTGTPREQIKLAQEDSDRHPVLAMEGDSLITFFVLHKQEGVKLYSENQHAILLRAFSTDSRHQGKGHASNVLTALPDFVKEHFDEINEIVLAVNLQNEAAQHLYKKSGYVDEGERRMGKKGELIIMSYYL
ncbi:acetyltransferase, gnat family protein [Neobacillus bataviensis LMG 21833]|uniref:Acetyltransferase, gnat family protein n=1 Tax=Neobacillus bataviensis LMG 21833 TaxID=1117379 RepID=K6EDS0_9BACI|nr:GNAT family protein [Neobacillus bataviensis]EKN71606.1 acetyltransferase, gnat family protein [Neobacillus bataviensis LMG 21833]